MRRVLFVAVLLALSVIPALSYGEGFIESGLETDWPSLWGKVRRHFDWGLEVRLDGETAWQPVEGLTVKRIYPEPNHCKVTLIVDTYFQGDYRVRLSASKAAVNHLQRDDATWTFTYQDYRLTVNMSDLMNIPLIHTKRGFTEGRFWFTAQRNNVPAGRHLELDPSLIVEEVHHAGIPNIGPVELGLSGGTLACSFTNENVIATATIYTSNDSGTTWNWLRDLTTTLRSQYPRMEVDSSGYAHVIYNRELAGGDWWTLHTGVNLQANTTFALGTTVFQDVGDGDGDEAVPDLCITSLDHLHAVLANQSENRVLYSNSTNNGLTWSNTSKLSGTIVEDSYHTPRVICDEGDDLYLFTYNKTGAGSYSLLTRNSTDEGASWGAWQTIHNESDPYIFDTSVWEDTVHLAWTTTDEPTVWYANSSAAWAVNDLELDLSAGVTIDAGEGVLNLMYLNETGVIPDPVYQLMYHVVSFDEGATWQEPDLAVNSTIILLAFNWYGDWGRGAYYPEGNRVNCSLTDATQEVAFLTFNGTLDLMFGSYTYSRPGREIVLHGQWVEDGTAGVSETVYIVGENGHTTKVSLGSGETKTVYINSQLNYLYYYVDGVSSTARRIAYTPCLPDEEFWIWQPESQAETFSIDLKDYTGSLPGWLEITRYINGSEYLIGRRYYTGSNHEQKYVLRPHRTHFAKLRTTGCNVISLGTYIAGDDEPTLIIDEPEWEDEGNLIYGYITASATRPTATSILMTYNDNTPDFDTTSINFTITYRNGTMGFNVTSTEPSSFTHTWNGANNVTDYIVYLTAQHEYWGTIQKAWLLDAPRSFLSFPGLEVFGSWGGLDPTNLLALFTALVVTGACSLVSATIAPFLGVSVLAAFTYLGGASFTDTQLGIGVALAVMAALALGMKGR